MKTGKPWIVTALAVLAIALALLSLSLRSVDAENSVIGSVVPGKYRNSQGNLSPDLPGDRAKAEYYRSVAEATESARFEYVLRKKHTYHPSKIKKRIKSVSIFHLDLRFENRPAGMGQRSRQRFCMF